MKLLIQGFTTNLLASNDQLNILQIFESSWKDSTFENYRIV